MNVVWDKAGLASQDVSERRLGLTLVELLVSIAVVALLAGILIPVVGTMTAYSRKTKCASNLHQLHALIMSYAVDNDNYLPGNQVRSSAGDPVPMAWWQMLLPSYTEESGIFACPEDETGYTTTNTSVFNGKCSYGVLAPDSMDGGTISAFNKNLNAFEDPARSVLLSECFVEEKQLARNWFYNKPGWPSQGTYAHGGLAHVLFVDGHISSFDAEKLQSDSEEGKIQLVFNGSRYPNRNF
jgi:prepilin-type N-terminal cleavage/methylation domain-containing protein/prepilin-type processing-associated H-X9-DG protein